MKKKQYTSPYLRVINVKRNDIIATSPYGVSTMSFGGSNGNGGPTVADVGGRGAWDDEDW